MAKIAVITDTNSGMSNEEAAKLGVIIVPMPFNISGTEYFEGISLTQDQFYEKLVGGDDISTSQPTPGSVMEIWDKALKDHDEVVYIPMSSGLSSSCQTALMLAEDYDGKVQVVNNHRISVTQKSAVLDALYLANKGLSAEQIKDKLLEEKANSSIYITLDTLYYLKKGGRITPAAAALGTLLKIKPVLQIQGEKLDSFAKARTMKAARQTMIDAIKADIEGKISEGGKYKFNVNVAHTNNYEAANQLIEDLKVEIPQAEAYYVDPLSLSIACHIGPGALAIAASRVVE